MSKIPQQIWDFIDKLHAERRSIELSKFIQFAVCLIKMEDEKAVPAVLLEVDPESTQGPFFQCPAQVMDFILDYIRDEDFHCAMDPAAGAGYVLGTLLRRGVVSRAVGYCKSFPEWAVASYLYDGGAIEWLHDSRDGWMDDDGDRDYDLVVSSIPTDDDESSTHELDLGGGRRAIFPCYKPDLVLLRAAMRLEPGGLGIFLTTRSMVSRHGETSVRAALISGNLFPIAAIDVAPAPSSGGDLLLILRRSPHPPDKVFVGVLPTDRNEIRLMAENARAGSAGLQQVPERGRMVDWDEYYSFEAFRAHEEFKWRSLMQGLPILPLGSLLASPDDTADPSNCISVSSDGVVRLACGDADRSGFCFRLDPEQLLAEYVVEYARSDLGRLALRAVGTASYGLRMTEDRLKHLPVILPSRCVQSTVLSVQGDISTLKLQLEREERHLWNAIARPEVSAKAIEHLTRKQTMSDWLDLLPFPLAACLYDSEATTDPSKVAEGLDFFFESYAMFEAIVLWSLIQAIETHVMAGEKDEAVRKPSRLIFQPRAPSRASWVALRGKFASVVARRGPDFPRDIGVSEVLLAAWRNEKAQVTRILERARTLRNDWRHGGQATPDGTASLVQELGTLVSDLNKAMGDSYAHLLLVSPTSAVQTGPTWECTVRLLRGSRRRFTEKKILSSVSLDSRKVYLAFDGPPDRVTNPVEVRPLMEIHDPTSAQPVCYFLNRVTEQNCVRWYCLHVSDKSTRETDAPESVAEMQRIVDWLGGK